MSNKTLYIHIPFCDEMCIYCDFTKLYAKKQNIDLYLERLIIELKKRNQGYVFSHLYIGGGTPSILTDEQIIYLFDNLYQNIDLANGAEITFECNPEHINKEKLLTLRSCKVNRISLGVQTFNDQTLTIINRKHSAKTTLKAIELINKYFENWSIDMIFSLPTQTIEQLENDIKIIKKINPPHFSYYSLIIEENTILTSSKSSYKFNEEEIEAEMFEMINNSFANYLHYEISNFALNEQFISKFNYNYWTCGEYLGIGLGAHSFLNNQRISNSKNLTNYYKGILETNTINCSNKEIFEEALFLGLRTYEGVNLTKLSERFSINPQPWKDIFLTLIDQKLVIIEQENYKLTKKGLFLANEVFEKMILI